GGCTDSPRSRPSGVPRGPGSGRPGCSVRASSWYRPSPPTFYPTNGRATAPLSRRGLLPAHGPRRVNHFHVFSQERGVVVPGPRRDEVAVDDLGLVEVGRPALGAVARALGDGRDRAAFDHARRGEDLDTVADGRDGLAGLEEVPGDAE